MRRVGNRRIAEDALVKRLVHLFQQHRLSFHHRDHEWRFRVVSPIDRGQSFDVFGFQRNAFHNRRLSAPEVAHAPSVVEFGIRQVKRVEHAGQRALRNASRIRLRAHADRRHDKRLFCTREGDIHEPLRLLLVASSEVAPHRQAPVDGAGIFSDRNREFFLIGSKPQNVVAHLRHSGVVDRIAHRVERASQIERHVYVLAHRRHEQARRRRTVLFHFRNRHNGELETLRRVNGHDAHRIAPGHGKRSGRFFRAGKRLCEPTGNRSRAIRT